MSGLTLLHAYILTFSTYSPMPTIDGWFEETRTLIETLSAEGTLPKSIDIHVQSHSSFDGSKAKSTATPRHSQGYLTQLGARTLRRLVEGRRPSHAVPKDSEPLAFGKSGFGGNGEVYGVCSPPSLLDGFVRGDEGAFEEWTRAHFEPVPAPLRKYKHGHSPFLSFVSTTSASGSQTSASGSATSSFSHTSSFSSHSSSSLFSSPPSSETSDSSYTSDMEVEDQLFVDYDYDNLASSVDVSHPDPGAEEESASPGFEEPDWTVKRVMPIEYTAWIMGNFDTIEKGEIGDVDSDSDSDEECGAQSMEEDMWEPVDREGAAPFVW